MNDPEFKQMLSKAIFILAVVIVFAVPVYFIYKNKIAVTESSLLKDIRKEKTFLLYITEDKCKICDTMKKQLDNNDVSYRVLNKSREKDYNTIIRTLELNSSTIYTPTLIYVEKGTVISYIVDIKSEEYLNDYLKNFK